MCRIVEKTLFDLLSSSDVPLEVVLETSRPCTFVSFFVDRDDVWRRVLARENGYVTVEAITLLIAAKRKVA